MYVLSTNPEELYSKDKNLKREDVEILQEWLKKQPHLPEILEVQVMMFLHSCFYRIEPAKATIDYYFTKRTHFPHIFLSTKEEEVRSELSHGFVNFFIKKSSKDCAVLVTKLFDCKPENFHFLEIVNALVMFCKLYIHRNPCPDGVVAVFDVKGLSLGHFLRLNPIIIKHIADFVQEGAPIRLKQINVTNVVPILDKILTMIKPLMKKELFDMIQIHSSLDTLHEQVEKECLPKELGGELPTYQVLHNETIEVLVHNYDFFKWQDSQVVDESKRLVKSKSFGEDGTFKRLAID